MRKGILHKVLPVLAMILLAAAPIAAQAPNTILYQGRLTTSAGVSINDTVTVLFSIYAASTGGSALWSASYTVSADVNGVFTQELGPILASVFDGNKRYIALKARTDNEMTPRQLLTSAPYAYYATAVGPNSVGTATIIDGSVANADLAANAVTAAKIADEPGIAWGYSSGYITLTLSDIVLDSAIITVPSAGYIVTIASLTFRPQHVMGTRDIGRFSISLTSKALQYGYSSMFTIPAAEVTDTDHPLPMALNRTDVAASAGTYRYYFVGNLYSGAAEVTNFNITAMFFPTAYGTVGKAALLPPPGFTPDPNLTDGGYSKLISQPQQ